MLNDYLKTNPVETIVDMDDKENKGQQLFALYYSENDLTQMLIGSSRDYYFEMDVKLLCKFINLVNEGQRAKSLFQNLSALFRHERHYIRALSLDSSQMRSNACHQGKLHTIRFNQESTFLAETCNGDTFVYSVLDTKRIEKQYWEVVKDGHMTRSTNTRY